MARARETVEAPPRNDRYVGMLALAAAAMFVGVVLLALEMSSYYDFTSTPPATPTLSLPKIEPRPTPPEAKAPDAMPAPGGMGKADPKPAVEALPAAAPTAVAVTPPIIPQPEPTPPTPVSVPVSDPRPGFSALTRPAIAPVK